MEYANKKKKTFKLDRKARKIKKITLALRKMHNPQSTSKSNKLILFYLLIH